jgi:hypothetical protein
MHRRQISASSAASCSSSSDTCSLLQRCGDYPHQQWPLDAAIERCDGVPVVENKSIDSLLRLLQLLLSAMSFPPVIMRHEPTAAQILQMHVEQQRIREIYRSVGAAAARSELANTLSGYYAPDYRAWRQREHSGRHWPMFRT